MRIPLVLTSLSLVLGAGCADRSDAGQLAETTAAPTTDMEPISHYSDRFDLLINPDTEIVAFAGTSLNCLFFWDPESGPRYTILNGTAVLTWDAMTPLSSQLRIVVTGQQGDEQSTVMAASPITLSFTMIEPDASRFGVGFWADYTLTAAQLPVLQSAQLDVDFEYTGDLPDGGLGTCAGGGL